MVADSTDPAAIKSDLTSYVVSDIVRSQDSVVVKNETDLLKSGILDSLSLMKLVVFVEKQFGIVVGENDLIPKNFASINAISDYVSARQREKK
jgi:acyl carrier protein